MKSPLLLICHRRPELTQNLFNIIKQHEPNGVYVFCDGPGSEKDKEKVRKTQEVIRVSASSKNFHVRFEEKNLGCGKAVKTALDWFFSKNEYGIILEDDIYPDQYFFHFMEEMLIRYKDNNSIASVSGFCPWPAFIDLGSAEIRTKYFSMWGWGTWARVWANYRLEVTEKLAKDWSQAIYKACESNNEKEFWANILGKLINKEIDTWDYQFFFQAWAHGQMHIRPSRNLVENLGFGNDATHTGAQPWFVKAQKVPLKPNEPHWFLDAAYFYFRHLTYLDNGNFSMELASKKFQDLIDENKKLKLLLQGGNKKQPVRKLFRSFFYRQ